MKRIVNCLFCFVCFFQPFLGQNNDTFIQAVENNLMNQKGFMDSTVRRFSIYERMKHYHVPSVSIAVINNGAVEWSKAYGMADVKEKTPATVHSRYQCASISKSVNSFCVMKLVEQGQLSLYQDIRGYLKTWSFPDNEHSLKKNINLLNLLSHTAGLSVHGFDGYKPGAPLPTINYMLDGKKPANNGAVIPVMPPMQDIRYSGGGTLLIKKILLDNVTNDYDSLVTAMVFKPLQMNESSFQQPLAQNTEVLASGHYGYKCVKGRYHIYPEQAPDGLWTTPSDLAKFVIEVQKSLHASGYLTDSLAKRMLTPVLPKQGNAALGFFIDTVADHPYFYHDGSNEGFLSLMAGSIDSGQGVVIMINDDSHMELIVEIYRAVIDVYKWPGFYDRYGVQKK